MATKFKVSGGFCWALERCEEIALIAANMDIERFIPATAQWHQDFEDGFFEQGISPSERHLAEINAVRKRKQLATFEVKEARQSPYGSERDRHLRAERRRDLRDWLVGMNDVECCRTVKEAYDEISLLRKPRYTYEEYQERRQQIDDDNALSRAQVLKRLAKTDVTAPRPRLLMPSPPNSEPAKFAELIRQAETAGAFLAASTAQVLANQSKPAEAVEALTPVLPHGRLVRMLGLATGDVRAELLRRIDPDEALDIAESVTDGALRNELVRHAMMANNRSACGPSAPAPLLHSSSSS